jgi:lysophospholipase L1-like esterase
MDQADVPVPRGDWNSQIAHEQLVAKAKAGRIDLYFLGDSITRRWGTKDAAWKDLYAHWKQSFWGWNAGNFGWGADSTQHILWRIQNGELEGVHPKVIVVQAGTNNIGGGQSAESVARGIRAILDTVRQKAPKATVILTGVFIRNDRREYLPVVRSVNKQLEAFADGDKVIWLDVNDGLAEPDGTLRPGMTIDQLHLSVVGYEVWAAGLRPHLERLLGPKSAIDVAPPPTGDPSAGVGFDRTGNL